MLWLFSGFQSNINISENSKRLFKFNLGIMIIFECWLKGFDLIERERKKTLNYMIYATVELAWHRIIVKYFTIRLQMDVYLKRKRTELVLQLEAHPHWSTLESSYTRTHYAHLIHVIPITIIVECLSYFVCYVFKHHLKSVI